MKSVRALVLGTGLAVLLAPAAQAAPIGAKEILGQFNLVVFGDVTGSSEVEGRTLIGGDLGGSSATFHTRNAPASAYDELIVGGNVTGGWKNVNNGGDVAVGGDVANMNLNGNGSLTLGGSVTGTVNGGNVTPGQPVSVPDFRSTLTQAAADLAGLTGQAPGQSGSRGLFTGGMPDTDGLVVYTLDLSFFDGVSEIEIALNGADTVIVNVTGSGPLTLADNFIGGSAAAAEHVLWNFPDITDLTLDRQFVGSILAPGAAVLNRNAIEGTLVANSFTMNGELHQRPFDGELPEPPSNVPAPATLGLLFAGLLTLGWAAHRRRIG